MKKPVPTVEKITPAIAKAWLDPAINHGNRRYRPHHAADLAREMTNGRWTYNNDAIAFGADGRLLNGQHRLNAIILSGKTLEMLVVRGLSDDDFKNMDGNLKRANHDRIHLVNEYTQNHLICQAIRTYLHETSGLHGAISVGEIETEFLMKDAAWTWIGEVGVGINAKLKKAGIMASLAIYRFVKPDMAGMFMDGYRTGGDLAADSPILKLRTMAMIGDWTDCTYWRVQSIMRAHLQRRPLAQVYPASEDMLGNKNSDKFVEARSNRGKKAAETRKKRQGEQGAGQG